MFGEEEGEAVQKGMKDGLLVLSVLCVNKVISPFETKTPVTKGGSQWMGVFGRK